VRITRELAAPRHPVLQPGRATIGAPEAVITIVEYSDFQCPYCRREVPVLKQLLQRHPGQVRLVLKQTPLPTHAHAAEAARMFEAVLRQGQERAWRYYDLLFENQERLAAEGGAYLDLAARAVGADVARARRDASSEEIAQIIAADQAEFQEFGFTGTPGFLVNGVVLDGSKPLQVFERVILRVLGGQAPPATLTRPEPSGPR
jgi:protein-disulfide isomerase